jgi:hypothetical protein
MMREATKFVQPAVLVTATAVLVFATNIGTTTAAQAPNSVVVMNGLSQPVPATLLNLAELGGGGRFQSTENLFIDDTAESIVELPPGKVFEIQHVSALIGMFSSTSQVPSCYLATDPLSTDVAFARATLPVRPQGMANGFNQFVVNEEVLVFAESSLSFYCFTNGENALVTLTLSGRSNPL